MGPRVDDSSSAGLWDAVPVNLVCRNLRYCCKHSRQPMYFYLLNRVLGRPKSRRTNSPLHPLVEPGNPICSQGTLASDGKDIWPLRRETVWACLLERASSICKSTWWIVCATNNFFQPPLKQDMEAPSERRWSWVAHHAVKRVAWLESGLLFLEVYLSLSSSPRPMEGVSLGR